MVTDMSVYRIYVEKKSEYAVEASQLEHDIRTFLQIERLESLRILNRYDVENIDKELFDKCKNVVFAEPQVDLIYDEIRDGYSYCFAVEYLPGQYDQRADSCAQCIQIVSRGQRPLVRTARVILLYGPLTDDDIKAVKKYMINPVETREASLDRYDTLEESCNMPSPVPVIHNFTGMDDAELLKVLSDYNLAMDFEDLKFCRDYFRSEQRDPTLTEIRVIDTYWSDHCRHTTFSTIIDSAEINDETVNDSYQRYLKMRIDLGQADKPVTLMDIATIGAKYLKAAGKLKDLDVSEEVNACSVLIQADVDGKQEPWLLMFKNETHNHPTEIEPFGGAATCIGGAIRDPLSGRSYVYQAMRVTGAGNPLTEIKDTLPGKLPQRKLITTAAAGYSSYGNQVGLATGLVDEIYHPGYVAKHMEIGAVAGAAPLSSVIRRRPEPGDPVIILGGRTGRDGCGGATGSSKSHTADSVEKSGAEVQKGNPPEERKIQRLFRNAEVSRIIKRCNDFGAGGVSVAIGELADSLLIDLDKIPKKYEGLDGTELAISESQERMAVVVAPEDAYTFMKYAADENLEATVAATVTDNNRLTMIWNSNTIVDISRDFLATNGTPKHTQVKVDFINKSHDIFDKRCKYSSGSGDRRHSLSETLAELVSDLNVCSKRGLIERFDSTIGAATVLMPLGGKYQATPAQAMAAKIPVLNGHTNTCSVMAYGYNPYIFENNPYRGAYLAVVESVSKLVATGASHEKSYLTFQEYFEKLSLDPKRWGKPFSALLGALDAQIDLGIGAIGGKDSMSGTFEDLDVPPTLVSFAVSVTDCRNVISPEFKKTGSKVVLLSPSYTNDGIPEIISLIDCYKTVESLIKNKKVISAYTPVGGGIAEGLFKMCLGNRIGISLSQDFDPNRLFGYQYGSFLLELADDTEAGIPVGTTCDAYAIKSADEIIDLEALEKIYEDKLKTVYPINTDESEEAVPAFSYQAKEHRGSIAYCADFGKPTVLIPVFPGTNCEYDTARALERAGAKPEVFVIKNLTKSDVSESIEAIASRIARSQIIVLPGGFSGGDEPDGSGKFITAFFRNPGIIERVHEFLYNKDGLICGICNGFQALIKLGLVPYGKIIDPQPHSPTLTFNRIGRHQSKLVHTRIASNKSPWLMDAKTGDIHTIAISHGEGRFIAEESLIAEMAENGQIATQYADLTGRPTMDIRFNPNGSKYAIEGITSPDGRVFGKMAHSERYEKGIYKNVPGDKDQHIFENAVRYYSF